METVKVAIADDHQVIRKGVRKLLEGLPNIAVVAEAEDGQEAIDIVHAVEPDLLILDIQMPVIDGLEVIDHLRKSEVRIAILVLSALDDPVFIEEVLLKGACLYIIKGDIPGLIQGIQQVVLGKCHKV